MIRHRRPSSWLRRTGPPSLLGSALLLLLRADFGHDWKIIMLDTLTFSAKATAAQGLFLLNEWHILGQ